MSKQQTTSLPILRPNLQIAFYYRVKEIRELYLHDALKAALKTLDLTVVDAELSGHVNEAQLKRVAEFGLRGEVLFPVPCLLTSRPTLLGYYRLLFGLSQKEFYTKGPFGRFKCLEDGREISEPVASEVGMLCKSLVGTGELLIDGLDHLSLSVIHDLQLLTLGPQLRGSQNTRIGQEAAQTFFDLLRDVVKDYVKETTKRTILIENASHRPVLIEFSSDPDVQIIESFESDVRRLVSVEIKGGVDASNIHNRLGEAEKSHQKARNRGFSEFWTVVRVDVDQTIAKRESPTTTQLFHLDKIVDRGSTDHSRFRDSLASVLGIRS